jgi:hypothetical protein
MDRFVPMNDEPEPEFRFTPSGMANAVECALMSLTKARSRIPSHVIIELAAHMLAVHSLDPEKTESIVGVAEMEEVAVEAPVQPPSGPALN